MTKYILTIILSLALCLNTAAQGIGTWTLYPSYADIMEIQPAGNKVYVLASNNLYSYSTTDGALDTYTKKDILSDNGISHIAWVQSAKRLVITYTNSNIDLLDNDGDILPVPDLFQKTTTDDKTINHVMVSGKFAYISTGYGIIKLNVATGEFTDSYRIGINVAHSYLKDGYLYAASIESGLYRCKTTDNAVDPNYWKPCGGYEEPANDLLNVKELTSDRHWTTITKDGFEGTFLTSYTLDSEGQRTYSTEGIRPDGPNSNESYTIEIDKGKVYVTMGTFFADRNRNNNGNVYVLNNGKWSYFQNDITAQTGFRYMDASCVAIDPTNNNHVMVGCKSGMFEFLNGKYVKAYRYGDEGVPLEHIVVSSSNYTNWGSVTQLYYENNGDLWVFNGNNPNMICLTKSGEWKVFPHEKELAEGIREYYISTLKDNRGLIWFCNYHWENSRLYCYDPAKDVLKRYDDFINQDGTSYSGSYLYCVNEDAEHNIWLGTSIGPLYLSAEDIRNGNKTFTQHKVPRNDGTNLADYLLSNITIRSMATDAANRKWFGTIDNGVYLISADNNTQEQHFTTDNSPLPSNTITDIKIDETTGCVYFATTSGLCSYMSDVTPANRDMSDDSVYAYPNPVSPEYDGPITIVGLEPGADVKILSTSGNLVHEGTVKGGSYQWNGRNKRGERVASGIYMVNVAKQNGDSGVVTKIAVVR